MLKLKINMLINSNWYFNKEKLILKNDCYNYNILKL